MRCQLTAIADHHSIFNNAKRTDGHILANLGGATNESQRVDT
jgi:hypothetical protein